MNGNMSEDIKNIEAMLLPQYLAEGDEIINYDVQRLTERGENYGSLMLAVELKVRTKDGVKTLNVVAKTVPPNEFIQMMFKTPLTFKKELGFYRTIVPALKQFQRDNGIEDVVNFFPEFYGGRLGLKNDTFDGNAVILMENLKFNGYYCADRTKGFDLETGKFILKDLATLHAVPIALKLKNPEEFNKKVLPFINNVRAFDGLKEGSVNIVIDELVDLAAEKNENVAILDNFRRKLSNSLEYMKNPRNLREPFATLIHCDFWVNNTMIKTENGRITGNKIVDFQLTEYGSPARDLIFFLFDSIQNEVISKHFDYLVQFYHQEFVEVLKKFQIETKPFALEPFKNEIDLAMNESVFFQCFIMLKPIFANRDAVRDIETFCETDLTDKVEIAKGQKEKMWLILKECSKRNWL